MQKLGRLSLPLFAMLLSGAIGAYGVPKLGIVAILDFETNAVSKQDMNLIVDYLGPVPYRQVFAGQ